MNIVFIYTGHYNGAQDAIRSAEINSGCPVFVYSRPEDFPVWNSTINLLGSRMENIVWKTLWKTSIARWFLLRELVKSETISLPIFCSDWDVLFFSPLESACESFMHHDYCHSCDTDSGTPISSAAYLVNKFEPLDMFCTEMLRAVNTAQAGWGSEDMIGWREVTRSGKFSVGDLFSITDSGVLDHNIACGSDRFIMEKPNVPINQRQKKIVWKDRAPYFLKLDQTPVKAHTIHCWGPFKAKTGELCKAAGI